MPKSIQPAEPAQPTHTVYLVDASPYIFRAHFSLPPTLVSPTGERAGAVYGFATALLKLIEEDKPTHLGIAFDRNLNGSFFRNQIYPAYKAQRTDPPAELVAQLDDCRLMAEALGAATFIDDRYEADDLIATLCQQLIAAGQRVVVVSGDKDLSQLVSGQVTLYDFGKGLRLGPAEVAATFGVRPDQIVDLLALAGDPVDNIPGVQGIGRKTAAELLEAFGTLDHLLDHLEQLRVSRLRAAKSLYAKLRDNRPIALLSRRLATLDTSAELHADLERLAYSGPRLEAIQALCARLGFKTLSARLAGPAESA